MKIFPHRDVIGRFTQRRRAEADITLTREEAPQPEWPEDLALRAFDEDPELRLIPAADRRTEQKILARLINDPDPRVRAAAAENPATSLIDAARVLRDDDPLAREAATRRMRTEDVEPESVDTAAGLLSLYGEESLG